MSKKKREYSGAEKPAMGCLEHYAGGAWRKLGEHPDDGSIVRALVAHRENNPQDRVRIVAADTAKVLLEIPPVGQG